MAGIKKKRVTKSKSKPIEQQKETVLLVIMGTTPAVLTETVWALCEENEIPGNLKVVPISAGSTANYIESELHKPLPEDGDKTIWEALRNEIESTFKIKSDRLIIEDVKVIKTKNKKTGRMVNLHDIRSAKDNEVVADFLLDEIRKITENSDLRLIASLSGGRKTMSAMMHVCMSLLARDTDRLTHVLVSDSMDSPGVKPKFYFPRKGQFHHVNNQQGKESRVSSDKVKVDLLDVPFLPLRKLFPKEYGGALPGKFSQLVRAYNVRLDEAALPEVSFEDDGYHVVINNKRVKFSGVQYALYRFLAIRNKDNENPIRSHKSADTKLKSWAKKWGKDYEIGSVQAMAAEKIDGWITETLTKNLGKIKEEFKAANLAYLESFLLPPPRGSVGIKVKLLDE